MFIHAPLFRKETKVSFTKSYWTDICRQEVCEIGYDTLNIEYLYEVYQLHVNMMFSIKYELFTYNRLINAYKYYNFLFELIFQITSISLLQGNFTFAIHHSYFQFNLVHFYVKIFNFSYVIPISYKNVE